jgi:hypothetical protein
MAEEFKKQFGRSAYERIKVKKEDAVDRSYKNEPYMRMTLPARVLACGPSGVGKTDWLMRTIRAIGIFDKIILWAKDLDEPLYKDLIEKCRAVEKKHKTRILLAITDGKDLPDLDKDINRKENTLLICDDLITEDPKSLKLLDPWWVRGRKMGVTMFFLTQGYFDVPKKIRKNSQYLVLKKIKNTMDLNRILREFALDVKPAELQEMYKYAMQGDPHTSFFMLDAETKDPDLQFRANFDPIPR